MSYYPLINENATNVKKLKKLPVYKDNKTVKHFIDNFFKATIGVERKLAAIRAINGLTDSLKGPGTFIRTMDFSIMAEEIYWHGQGSKTIVIESPDFLEALLATSVTQPR